MINILKLQKLKAKKFLGTITKKEVELFFIIDGKLLMEIENKPNIILKKGDLYIVKKGVNHRVSSQEECLIMLIESKTTEHTGNVKSKITKSIEEQKY